MNASVLVVGEALIDMIPEPSDAAAGGVFRAVPGGSPFNVALALGRLDIRVRFLCPFSRDAFGELLLRTQRESGVDHGWCRRTEALSTLGFVTVDPVTKGAGYAFYTAGTAGCSLVASDIPEHLPDAVRIIHAGSFSLAIEPFGTSVEALLQREAGRRLIAVDPNIRPFLVPDRSRFMARWERILARADVVKLSDEDLAWLHPDREREAALDSLLDAGPGLVVLTRGGNGCIGWTRGVRVDMPGEAVAVVDTVGAGDTFQAALLAGLLERGVGTRAAAAGLGLEELRGVLGRAGRSAALNCTRRGCQPPWRRELDGGWSPAESEQKKWPSPGGCPGVGAAL